MWSRTVKHCNVLTLQICCRYFVTYSFCYQIHVHRLSVKWRSIRSMHFSSSFFTASKLVFRQFMVIWFIQWKQVRLQIYKQSLAPYFFTDKCSMSSIKFILLAGGKTDLSSSQYDIWQSFSRLAYFITRDVSLFSQTLSHSLTFVTIHNKEELACKQLYNFFFFFLQLHKYVLSSINAK